MTWHIRNPDEYNTEGGPAFGHGNHEQGGHPGMSLRDWFAGQMLPRIGTGWPNIENREQLAKQAYQMADAMLAERSKQP